LSIDIDVVSIADGGVFVGVASAKADALRWRSLALGITALPNRDDVRWRSLWRMRIGLWFIDRIEDD
jgi:hypothetical protein